MVHAKAKDGGATLHGHRYVGIHTRGSASGLLGFQWIFYPYRLSTYHPTNLGILYISVLNCVDKILFRGKGDFWWRSHVFGNVLRPNYAMER